MLRRLQIENFALIDRVVLEFASGLNVLSGETGSGKSIIVDALGQLLGARADATAVRAGAEQANITGTFVAPFATAAAGRSWYAAHGLSAPEEGEHEVTLRRELGASGRHRSFIDNQPVTLAVLRALATELGAVHAQGETLTEFAPAEQLELLDRFAAAEPLRERVASAYAAWDAATRHWREWLAGERTRRHEAEQWQSDLQEIDAAAPRPGEDEALEQERLRLAHAERIAAAAQAIYERLYEAPEAVTAQLKGALRQLQDWQRYDAAAAPLLPRVDALLVEARDIAEQVRDLAAGIEAAPARLRQVEDRLELLGRLKRKFGPTLAEVAAARAALAQRRDEIENSAAQASDLADAAAASETAYRTAAGELAARRRAAATRLAPRLVAEAEELGMQIRFEIGFEPAAEGAPPDAAWSATGWDRVRFLVSANAGEPLQPIERVASGGELSRLLLALHLIAERGASTRRARAAGRAAPPAPRTLVLDEIDTGIGGRAAEAVGAKLRQLGEGFQVLCVTHLAQIATFATRHVRVEKIATGGRTHTEVRALERDQRVEEIARMLAGNRVGATALRHARELLAAHAGG